MERKGKPRRPLLCGYYGEHNLGDDVLLEVLLSQLPPGCQPVVTAHDQRWVGERFGVQSCDRRRLGEVMGALAASDVLVLGGGSLLQDATSLRSLLYYWLLLLTARLLGKRVLLWGQGLGPLKRRISRLLVRGILPLVSAISWRDGASAELARRLGRRRQLVGSDPVWAYPRRTWQGEGGPIVLCWRPVRELGTEGWRPYLQALTSLTQASGRDVLWLPFHQEQDQGLLQLLHQSDLMPPALAARSHEVVAENAEQAMAFFSRAGLVLAMRLHGLILAALAGSPVTALSYDPKVAAVARALNCPLLELGTAPDPAMGEQWLRQLDQPPSEEAIAALRAGTEVHEQLLRQVLLPK